jgi:hypothetical protein
MQHIFPDGLKLVKYERESNAVTEMLMFLKNIMDYMGVIGHHTYIFSKSFK